MPKKQTKTESAHAACERAADELARQMGIIISDGKKTRGIFPAEFLNRSLLRIFGKKKGTKLSLLLTATRAKAIGIKAKNPVLVDIDGLSLDAVLALADPTHVVTQTWQGLSARIRSGDSLTHALTLAKQAALLPALLVIDGACPKEWLTLPSATLAHAARYPVVEVLRSATARLPLKGAENTRIVSFRTRHSTAVHLALLIGEPEKQSSTLARIHSSCVTGDILGSLRCDCGDQLHMALSAIISEKNGILIYLHQEGRGIGITNKLRAYTLQEQGVDTYHANRMLGFEDDERDFAIAGAILKQLGLTRLRLLTNNPLKQSALKNHGITIKERVPLVAKSSKHSHAYLSAKSLAGHQF